MSRPLAAVAMAAVLTLSLVSTALAGTITESVTVLSTFTVTGIPASLSYGPAPAGGTSGVQMIDFTVEANTAWTATISGTDFTGPSSTMPKSAREGQLSCCAYTAFGTSPYDGIGVWLSGGIGTTTDNLKLRVRPPAGTAPGAYSGEITYNFSAT